jgi:uncharacterized DUF497 family protein
MKFSGFQWDDGNWPKCGMHGITKSEIEAVFDGDVRVAPDFKHSASEQRYIAIARDISGRRLFVGFTLRQVGERLLVRPFTARYMHEKEALRYEAQSAKDDDRRGS